MFRLGQYHPKRAASAVAPTALAGASAIINETGSGSRVAQAERVVLRIRRATPRRAEWPTLLLVDKGGSGKLVSVFISSSTLVFFLASAAVWLMANGRVVESVGDLPPATPGDEGDEGSGLIGSRTGMIQLLIDASGKRVIHE